MQPTGASSFARPDARLAEVLGAFAFANDLAFGLAQDDSVRSCYLANRIADHLAVSDAERRTVYYAGLLKDAGCTSWTSALARFWLDDEIVGRRELLIFGGSQSIPDFVRWLSRHVGSDLPPLRRIPHAIDVARRQRQVAREGFEATRDVAMRIANRLGMSSEVQAAVCAMFEQWDGHGMPDGVAGEAIPPASRIILPTMTLAPVAHRFGHRAALDLARQQRGHAFAPDVVDAFIELTQEESFWLEFEGPDVWEQVLRQEPRPRVAPITEAQLDEVVLALADFTDLKAPHVLAHSRRTSVLAEALARELGCDAETLVMVRRAALVHDLGLVAVPSWVLGKPEGRLTPDDREQLRLHPYHAERILGRAPALAALAEVAGLHHERGDGTGYFRGLSAPHIPLSGRIVAVAAAFDELTHDGPGRPAAASKAALERLRQDGHAPEVVAALEAGLGLRTVSASAHPAGLTDREVEVLRLVAAGLTRREISQRLGISEHTARHHIAHVYDKIGVSNRVTAAMFAMEHGLLA